MKKYLYLFTNQLITKYIDLSNIHLTLRENPISNMLKKYKVANPFLHVVEREKITCSPLVSHSKQRSHLCFSLQIYYGIITQKIRGKQIVNLIFLSLSLLRDRLKAGKITFPRISIHKSCPQIC